jgi:hypothetical protein
MIILHMAEIPNVPPGSGIYSGDLEDLNILRA